jgi:hypothetical protein
MLEKSTAFHSFHVLGNEWVTLECTLASVYIDVELEVLMLQHC